MITMPLMINNSVLLQSYDITLTYTPGTDRTVAWQVIEFNDIKF